MSNVFLVVLLQFKVVGYLRKKKWFALCLCVFIVFVSFYFWDNRDDGEFVPWGDSVHSVDTAVLKRNDIKYKIENDKVYIPKNHLIKQYGVALNKCEILVGQTKEKTFSLVCFSVK